MLSKSAHTDKVLAKLVQLTPILAKIWTPEWKALPSLKHIWLVYLSLYLLQNDTFSNDDKQEKIRFLW